MIKEVGIDLRPDLTIEGVTCGREVGCGCSHLGKWGYPVISSKDVSRIGNRGGSGRGGGSRGGVCGILGNREPCGSDSGSIRCSGC